MTRRWQILSATQRNVDGTHTHVNEVWLADGLADEDRSEAAYEVIKKMTRDEYYTVGDASGEETVVEIVKCSACNKNRLATFPTDPDDLDLDHFPQPGESEPPRRFGPKVRAVDPPRPKRKPPEPRSR